MYQQKDLWSLANYPLMLKVYWKIEWLLTEFSHLNLKIFGEFLAEQYPNFQSLRKMMRHKSLSKCKYLDL